MEESLELRIDVSLDQDKDSYVDVVNLESDCSIASSSSSSDGGNISGPEHVELVSPQYLQRCSDLLARGSPVCHLLRDVTI